VTDLLPPAEVEDRLRRTLIVRAGDVPPADDLGPPPLPVEPAPGRHRRGRVVLAAAAAAVVVTAAAGAVVLAGGEDAATVPGQEAPPTTGVDSEARDAEVARRRHELEEQLELERQRLDELAAAPETTVAPDSPAAQAGGALPSLVAGYQQIGVAPNQEVWLYLTWYPRPGMAREPIPGHTREGVEVAETEAVLETATDYPARTVWLFYEDGTLGVHSGAITRDEVLGVAASVRRTSGTLEFTSTPPPGWEVSPR
jgi:hypothetical protein